MLQPVRIAWPSTRSGVLMRRHQARAPPGAAVAFLAAPAVRFLAAPAVRFLVAPAVTLAAILCVLACDSRRDRGACASMLPPVGCVRRSGIRGPRARQHAPCHHGDPGVRRAILRVSSEHVARTAAWAAWRGRERHNRAAHVSVFTRAYREAARSEEHT